MRTTFRLLLALLPLVPLVSCATKSYVREEVRTTHARLDDVEGQVEANQTRLNEQETRLDDQELKIGEVSLALDEASQTAREAFERAQKAGKLAEGKLLFETVLSDENVRFDFDQADLGADARAALDSFAAQLITANEQIYIEIQGHTDSTGEESYNLELGYERAQAVLRYLNMRHGLPLHRTSAISYGESAPVADNSTREGRAKNRRVVLVVLR